MAQETVFIDFVVNYEELDNAQAALAKTGKVDTKGFQAIQAAIDTTATDSKGLIKTFKDVAGASIKMGKSVEDAFASGIQDALDEAGVTLKEFEGALKKTTQPAQSLKKEMLQLKEALARMKAEGKDTGKEFEALRARAGKLADAIADANAEIKNAGSDTKGIDNVIGSISALAGGYAAVQGAAALFGEENEDLQKALLKVNGAMALATGAQQVLNALQKEGSLIKLKDAIATGTQAAATTLYTFVATGATVATKVFRAALIATGIGAFIILVLALVEAMSSYGGKTETAAEAQQRLADATANLNKALGEQITFMNDVNALNVLRAKAAGKTEAEITAIERAAIAERIAIRAKAIDQAIKSGLDISEITEQQNADITALQKFDLDIQVKRLEAEKAFRKKRLDALVKAREEAQKQDDIAAQNYITSALARIDAEENAERIKYDNISDIKAQFDADQKAGNDAYAKQWEAFQDSLTKSAEKAAADQIKIEEAKRKKLIETINTVVFAAERVTAIFSELSSQQTSRDNEEIAGQRRKVEEQLRAGTITQKAAEARQKQIDQQERLAKQRAAEREKKAAVFQALIAIPKAFLQGLGTGGPILGAIYAALAAVEAALIISRPVPKFFRGKKGNYEGPGEVADMGAEIVERDGRMYLYTKPTQTYLGAQDKVYTAGETRSMMHNSNLSTTPRQNGVQIDYNRMAAAMPKHTAPVINIDKEFISESVANGLSRINYMDRRYSSKR